MQASRRMLTMRQTASILFKEEGLVRFWKGSPVMASGCIPAHASYFLAYEHLKVFFDFHNESYAFLAPIAIGCTTTFAHDLFITPADGKHAKIIAASLMFVLCSNEIATATL